MMDCFDVGSLAQSFNLQVYLIGGPMSDGAAQQVNPEEMHESPGWQVSQSAIRFPVPGPIPPKE